MRNLALSAAVLAALALPVAGQAAPIDVLQGGLHDLVEASPFGDKSGAPNHSSEFVIDEKALRIGVRALTSATLAYMAQNPAAKR